MSESIEKKLLLGNLYDYYARLLTEKQREILDQYCMDDLSLVEISENLGISRQAVYDTVRKAEKQMLGLEEILGLSDGYARRKVLLNEAMEMIRSVCENPTERFERLSAVEELLSQAAE